MSKKLHAIFSHDRLLAIVNMGEAGTEVLKEFCGRFLAHLHTAEAMQVQKACSSASVDAIYKIDETFVRLKRLMLALLYAMGKETFHIPGTEETLELTHRACIYFVEYTGKAMFERTWKGTLLKEGTWWRQQMDEIVKVAASTLLSAPLISQLTQMLESEIDPFSLDAHLKLQDCIETYRKVIPLVRKIQLDKFSKQLCNNLITAAEKIISQQTDSELKPLTSTTVDAILDGLSMFDMIAGTISSSEALLKWMKKEEQRLVRFDLLTMIQAGLSTTISPEHFDFEQFSKLVEKAKKYPAELSPNAVTLGLRVAAKMIKGLVHKACVLNSD